MTDNGLIVSIGVPVYNGAAFLEETLDSLLAQTFEDVARDARVRYHRNPENLGLATNYNRLVQMALSIR